MSVSAEKTQYKISNWPEYNRALKERGSLTLWIEEDVLEKSISGPSEKKRRGRPVEYNDGLIEMILQLKAVFSLPLRGVEGFTRSILKLMKLDKKCPDYSTLSRRAKSLSIDIKRISKISGPIEIAVDSTGLKLFGEGEWKVRKHGPSRRRKWRKLHLAVDVNSGEIVASVLTDNDVHDADVMPEICAQIPDNIDACSGDGAYDTRQVRQALHERGIKQKIPPQKNAVPQSPLHPNKYDAALRERDEAIDEIDAYGGDDIARKIWKAQTGYHKRSLSENAMFRRKTLFSPKLSARNFDNQQVESAIIINAMNKITALGMPISHKIT